MPKAECKKHFEDMVSCTELPRVRVGLIRFQHATTRTHEKHMLYDKDIPSARNNLMPGSMTMTMTLIKVQTSVDGGLALQARV